MKKSVDTKLMDQTPKTPREVFLTWLKRFVGGGSTGAIIIWAATNSLTYLSDLKASVRDATTEAKQLRLITTRNEEMIRVQWTKIKEKNQAILELEVRLKVLEHLQTTGSGDIKYTLVIQSDDPTLAKAEEPVKPTHGALQKLGKFFNPTPEDKAEKEREHLADEIKKLDRSRKESVEDYSNRAVQEQRVEQRHNSKK